MAVSVEEYGLARSIANEATRVTKIGDCKMLRFQRPELLLAFAAGIMFFALWETLLGYQAANCSYQQEYKAKANPSDSHATTSNKSSDGYEESGHKAVSEPFVCGVAGIPTAVRQFMNRNEGFFVGGFTLMLVFVTGSLVWATLKLWNAGEKQFGFLSENAAAQSRQMEASLTAATESNRIMEKNLFVEQRPWIGAPEITENPFTTTPDDEISFLLTFKNVGKTPTYGIDFHAEIVSQPVWESRLKVLFEVRRKLFDEELESRRTFSIVPHDKYYVGHGKLSERKRAAFRKIVDPHIIGCVIYGSHLGEIVHKTGFVIPIGVHEDGRLTFSNTYAVGAD